MKVVGLLFLLYACAFPLTFTSAEPSSSLEGVPFAKGWLGKGLFGKEWLSKDWLKWKFVKKKKKRKYPLAVCAIFRNEANFLKEWIEYHMMIGASHFYLYNNLSEDHYLEVLQPYIDRNVVELFDWPYESEGFPDWNAVQCNAYNDALARAKKRVGWLAVIDTDEYIVPVHAKNLVKYLSKFRRYGGLAINWQLFGTSFVERLPKDKLMIECLILKAPEQFEENRFVKSIVNPRKVAFFGDPHCPDYKSDYFAITSDKRRLPGSITGINEISAKHIRIHHYWARTEDFFWDVKVGRRAKWKEGLDGMLRRLENINQVPDWTMMRFVPKLRKRMGLEKAEAA